MKWGLWESEQILMKILCVKFRGCPLSGLANLTYEQWALSLFVHFVECYERASFHNALRSVIITQTFNYILLL
jgi:hypothetical protein